MNGLVQIMSKLVQHNAGMSHDDNLLLFSYVWHCIMYHGLEITAVAPLALSEGSGNRKPGGGGGGQQGQTHNYKATFADSISQED